MSREKHSGNAVAWSLLRAIMTNEDNEGIYHYSDDGVRIGVFIGFCEFCLQLKALRKINFSDVLRWLNLLNMKCLGSR